MGIVTYDEFVAWCKHWGYTIEEGYKAMCFTANIIGQYFGNYIDYENKNINDYSSEAFKEFFKKEKHNAILLSSLYGELERMVFDMLEEHEKKE